jgi:hypothetical protein
MGAHLFFLLEHDPWRSAVTDVTALTRTRGGSAIAAGRTQRAQQGEFSPQGPARSAPFRPKKTFNTVDLLRERHLVIGGACDISKMQGYGVLDRSRT